MKRSEASVGVHNPTVDDVREKITELADLMDAYQLTKGKWCGPDWKIAFERADTEFEDEEGEPTVAAVAVAPRRPAAPRLKPAEPERPVGFPISSPMMGIFYLTPSPGNPPFVKEGQTVEAGQVIGLIEAMKVFNELTAPSAGTVVKVVKANGDLVQPGEPIMFIG